MKLFNTEEKKHLLKGFTTFIPAKYKTTYMDLLSKQLNSLKSNDIQSQSLKDETESPPHKFQKIMIDLENSPPKSKIKIVEEKTEEIESSVELTESKESIPMKSLSEPQAPFSQQQSQTKANSKKYTDFITGRKVNAKRFSSVKTKSEPILEKPEESKEEEVEEGLSEDELQEGDTGGIKCTICQLTATAPFSSRCGHICCKSCWNQWLKEQLTCPVCRTRVRQKQLTKLYFV